MYIPIFLGTARDGRSSEKAAKFMLEETKKAGITSEIIDPRQFHIHATDKTEHTKPAHELSEKAKRADGFIIVTPEYNHGYPGELKIMLDMLYPEYARKPVGICGVSVGGLGGARVVEQLRLVAIEFQMVPIRSAVYFSNVGGLFDEHGNMKDASYSERAQGFLKELLWYAEALKKARE